MSRPTFDKYRREFGLSQFKIGKTTFFSKLEILDKIYRQKYILTKKIELHFEEQFNLDDLKIDNFSYDLRRIASMDGAGAIQLLCHLISRIKNENCYIHLIFDESNLFLKTFNFFGVIHNYLNSKIFWNNTLLDNLEESICKFPIKKFGFIGSQLKIVDDIISQLESQGFSKNICAYLGWALGELSDNAITHAASFPCFFQLSPFGDNDKILLLTVGDVGKGIPVALRENKKYHHLTDAELLLLAFKPHVSGRDDNEARGKGLTDVLKIAMDCNSILSLESNGLGYSFRFNSGIDNLKKNDVTNFTNGTIVSLLLIDGNFASFTRDDVSNYLDKCMRKI